MYQYIGYGVTFTRDRDGDIFTPDSFTYSLPIAVLFNHNGPVIGYVNSIEVNAQGVVFKFSTYKHIPESYLSIGFRVIKSRNMWYRILDSIEILELSIVSTPAQFNTKFNLVIPT